MQVKCAFCGAKIVADEQGKCSECNAKVFTIPLKDLGLSPRPWIELSLSIADVLSWITERYGEALSSPAVLCEQIMIRTTYNEQSKALCIFQDST